MASPFGCRSGHIPLSRKPPCPGTGRLARASALLLMHRQRSITIRDGQHTPCSNDHRPLPLWLERHSRTTEQRNELAPFHCPNATSRVYEYTFWLVASSAILAERVKVSSKGLRRMDVRRGPMHNDRDLHGLAVTRS